MSRPWHLELGDGRTLPCRVIRNRRYRRVGLRVTPQELRISAPSAASRRELAAVAERHREWIRTTLDRLAAARPRDAIHGDPLPRLLPLRALDTEWHIDYHERDDERVRVHRRGDRVEVWSAAHLPIAEPLAGLQRFLMREARRALGPRLALLADHHGLSYDRISIRAQRTRWGSCSGRGTISLNYRLLFLPPALVDYVLLHELAHTRERNHSPRFWGLLTSMAADARERDRALDRCTPLIPAWTEGH